MTMLLESAGHKIFSSVADADSYVDKPLDRTTLVDQVEAILEG